MYIYRLKDGNVIVTAFEVEAELIAADAVKRGSAQTRIRISHLGYVLTRKTYTVETRAPSLPLKFTRLGKQHELLRQQCCFLAEEKRT